MKALRAAATVVAFAICGLGNAAFAATPDPDFGTPPSGEVPILYNDHTVYAKPDTLHKSRVLAAFVKGGEVYVPLRSMFEQMGATVTASDDGKTFTAQKPGVTVSVRLGSSVVTINGEERPLDVPPMMYRGAVLVPVRVISEALGAYVLWVPDKRVVVVRYIPIAPPPPTEAPTPPPTPAPVVTAPPTPIPTPAPTVAPTKPPYPGFIEGAFSDAKNYNEFADGQNCPHSYVFSAAWAFKDSPIAVKVDYRLDSYLSNDNYTDALQNQYTRYATTDGGYATRPVFLARQSSVDERVEYQVAAPRVYVGVGYVETSNNYGYPHLSGVGGGIEKIESLRPGLDLSGSVFYYPNARGTGSIVDPGSPNNGLPFTQEYRIVKYDVGLSIVFRHSPVYLHGGFAGDSYGAKQNAPVGQTHAGPYLGLGVRL
jgi:hypothetical protein